MKLPLRYFSPLWLHRPRPARGFRKQLGQSLLFVALMFVVLIGVVGLAVDGAVAYAYSVAVERGAAAAALAGAPFMPQQFNSPPNDNAFDRATAEAARNGYVNGVNNATVSIPNQTGSPQLSVTITQQAPTFFMHALGFPNITVSRTAVAGYRPPIALGQPGAQLGSTVSNLGSGNNFYFPRFKGWNNHRSEGDAFTPNPIDAGGNTSADVHQYSDVKGTETSQVACDGSSPLGSTWALPCRGGFNYRVFVPAGVTAELDVYNAAYSPDFGTTHNKCENSKNVSTCNNAGGSYANAYWYHEEDNGARCPCVGNGNQDKYNAAGYTLFQVPDLFLRQNDKALVQTKVLPIDATNWDGNNGGTGKGGTNTPSYVNVNTDAVINQSYAGGNTGDAPTNMQIYHAWADINNLPTSAAPGLIQRKTANGWAGGSQLTGGAQGTYYRLRIDALKYDGTVSNTGASSHGWAVRAVNPGTQTACANCQVAAWNDLTVYTPLASGTGRVPLFQLPKEYAGSTIDVDVFDVGDSSGDVNLSILDPNNSLAVAQTVDQSTLNVWNEGINRFNADQTCASGCVIHTPGGASQGPNTKPLGPIPHTQSYQATYEAANSSYGAEYQGSWIRIEIPIPPECGSGQNPPACYRPPASPNDYWQLQYVNTGGATDTFTFAVSAKGGPVHLVSS